MGFPLGWTDSSFRVKSLLSPAILTRNDLDDALQYSSCQKSSEQQKRIKLIGNAIVPQVAKLGFDRILELESQSMI